MSSSWQLKAVCGQGVTAKDGDYEAQGDHVATVMAALVLLGCAAIDKVQVGQTHSYRGLLGNSGLCTTTRISTEVIRGNCGENWGQVSILFG